MLFLFKNYSYIYLFIRYNKTKLFLWNRKGGGGRGEIPSLSLDASDSAKRSKYSRHHFFELEIYQETETSSFFVEIFHANELQVKVVSLNVPEFL